MTMIAVATVIIQEDRVMKVPSIIVGAVVVLALFFPRIAVAQPPSDAAVAATDAAAIPSRELFDRLFGKWKGSCKTWFKPGKLADESPVVGVFQKVLDGRFVRHTYEGQMRDRPRHGEELLAYNAITKQYETCWVDDFHMSYALMMSKGTATARGFNVRGEYDVAENDPKWGWRTEYQLIDDDHLTITAYNVQPNGKEAKAVETKYERQE